MTRRGGHRPDTVAEHGYATTEGRDPVTSTTDDTSDQSGSKRDVGISKDRHAITESTCLRTPCASGNLQFSGKIFGTSNARSLTTNVNESVQQAATRVQAHPTSWKRLCLHWFGTQVPRVRRGLW